MSSLLSCYCKQTAGCGEVPGGGGPRRGDGDGGTGGLFRSLLLGAGNDHVVRHRRPLEDRTGVGQAQCGLEGHLSHRTYRWCFRDMAYRRTTRLLRGPIYLAELNSPLPQGKRKGTVASTSKRTPPGGVPGASSSRQTCFTDFNSCRSWRRRLQDGPQPRSCEGDSQVGDRSQL